MARLSLPCREIGPSNPRAKVGCLCSLLVEGMERGTCLRQLVSLPERLERKDKAGADFEHSHRATVQVIDGVAASIHLDADMWR
jgi:hypothetical protein